MYVPDNLDAYNQHEHDIEKAYERYLVSLPTCNECGERIESDVCYLFDGEELLCEDCIEKKKVCTENYMRE